MGSDERRPVAGRDYPSTWQAFEAWFVDDDVCRAFLVGLRWPDGFVCPACGEPDGWETKRGLFMCRSCGRQTSVTAGTIFHRTRTPLRTWFAAIWFVCAQKNGVSALGLQRVLGFGSYETAWAWMHKLRRAMVRPDRDRLGGPGVSVEMDCTFLGGATPTRRGARYHNKTEIAIAVERRHPKGLGRARLRLIDSAERKTGLEDFAAEVIAPGTILYTDGDRLYKDWPAKFAITHERIILTGASQAAHQELPAVHRVAALLKRWIAGTLHDRVSDKHLGFYLDEFTFRFNRRTSRSRGLLFYRLCQQAMNTDPHPLRDLIDHTP
ncbi:MAG: IS1595 family transposase [Actinomycetia bacterium]|nr:IS1595 family transposase [Actinomycetes bacterium]